MERIGPEYQAPVEALSMLFKRCGERAAACVEEAIHLRLRVADLEQTIMDMNKQQAELSTAILALGGRVDETA